MSDINSITLTGRLVRDPENKQFDSGKNACKFSIANSRKYAGKEETSFFNCVAFGKLGEITAQYRKKGDQIAVSGRISQRTWDSPEGKKSVYEVIVGDVSFIGGSGKSMNSQHPDTVPTESHEVPF